MILDRLIENTLDRLGFIKQDNVPPSMVFSGEKPLGQGFGNWSQEKQERLAVQTSWVYSDIQLIARECSRVPLEVYEQTGEELEAIEAHDFEVLMRRPHRFFSRAFLMQYTIFWLLLRGEAYWWQVGDNAGELSSIIPIPANRMHPIPDEQNYIRGFAYRKRHGGKEIPIPTEQVCWFRLPNPFDYHRGLSPMTAYRRAVETDYNMVKWNAETYEKGSPLRQIIGLPQELRDDVYREAREQIRQELQEGMRYIIAKAGQLTAEDVGLGQKDMEFMAGREFTREEIDRVFGIPAGYWAKEATRANSEAAKMSLIEGAVWPLLSMIHDEVTTWVVQPRYGENLVARFEDIRPRDRKLQLAERKQAQSTQTLNEARQTRGQSEYEGPMADAIADLPVPLATDPQFVMSLQGMAPVGMMSDMAQEDLRKWETVALKRVKDGNDPGAYDFVSDYIPDKTLRDVRRDLNGVQSSEAVKAVFAHHRGEKVRRGGKSAETPDDPLRNVKRQYEQEITRNLLDIWIYYGGRFSDWLEEQVGTKSLATDVAEIALWDELEQELKRELLPDIEGMMQDGARDAIDKIPFNIGVDWDEINTEAAEWAREYSASLIQGVNETTRDRVKQNVANWIEAGEDLPFLKKRMRDVFNSPSRAEMVAVTETTNVFAEANERAWEASRVVEKKEWRTAVDDRVCFPAGTEVETDRGAVPIQDIEVGNHVLTRQGYKVVEATNERNYSGRMVRVSTDKCSVIATEGHPFWTSKEGWLQGRYLNIGHRLQTLDNETAQVRSLVNFGLGNMTDAPSLLSQIFISSSIFGGILMPVIPIDFQANSEFGQEKVNGITSNGSLLNIFDSQLAKRFPNSFFEERFSLISSIAGEAAELPISISRFPSKLLPTVFAFDNVWRAPTFFGAEMSIFRLGTESFSTTFTSFVDSVCGSAFPTTMSIPIGDSLANREFFATSGADLGNHVRRMPFIVAFPATKATSLGDLAGFLVGLFSANRTGYHLSRSRPFVIAFSRAKDMIRSELLGTCKRFATMGTDIFKRHDAYSMINSRELYHKQSDSATTVYNLQVKDVPEFYANGILVHNCPICGPLHGMQRNLGKTFPGGILRPSAHPRCRCWLVPIVEEA